MSKFTSPPDTVDLMFATALVSLSIIWMGAVIIIRLEQIIELLGKAI